MNGNVDGGARSTPFRGTPCHRRPQVVTNFNSLSGIDLIFIISRKINAKEKNLFN